MRKRDKREKRKSVRERGRGGVEGEREGEKKEKDRGRGRVKREKKSERVPERMREKEEG